MASGDLTTKRLDAPRQDLSDAYSLPANFLEIEVCNPETHGVGWRQKHTDYEVKLKTNLPVFKHKEISVRRRYRDFKWLMSELERESKIVVPPLPTQGLSMQMPFRNDEGIFSDSFIEERRQGLEAFINKLAGHPLAQNEKCLHMFLQEKEIDKNYIPGKVRTT